MKTSKMEPVTAAPETVNPSIDKTIIVPEDFPNNSYELTCCIAKVLLHLYNDIPKDGSWQPLSSRGVYHALKRHFDPNQRVRLLRLATASMIEKVLNHLANNTRENKPSGRKSADKYYSFNVYEPCCSVVTIHDSLYIVDVYGEILKKALWKSKPPKSANPAALPFGPQNMIPPPLMLVDENDETERLFSALNDPTAMELIRNLEFRTKSGIALCEVCEFGTRQECICQNPLAFMCPKVHFRRIILPHTNVGLGDCSYLDTCRHIETCRFVHYEVEDEKSNVKLGKQIQGTEYAQWISCDVRKLDFSIFNPFVSVVMADPPWDIHMDLPYGTMKDGEMKNLKVQDIQSEGLLFLWVTGRTLEVGKECMEIWGYQQIDEILWVKTNQLQRVIRTGRTGHWINHSKEHCLIGIKGTPAINRFIDCDVLISEVRETSRKPDEIYSIIERMVPNSLKLELFGRSHNIRNSWITIGNELDSFKLLHSEIKKRYEAQMTASNNGS